MGEQPGPEEPASPMPGQVRSADGTPIGYYRIGDGPALILLHGAGQSSGSPPGS